MSANSLANYADIDAAGIFRMNLHTLNSAIDSEEAARVFQQFFPSVDDDYALSRGEPYYNLEVAFMYFKDLIKVSHQMLKQAGIHTYEPVIASALLENFFNILATFMFSFWEKATDGQDSSHTKKDIHFLTHLLEALQTLAFNHLCILRYGNAAGRHFKEFDWDFIQNVTQRLVPHTTFRTFREFDNKLKIVNEVAYLRSKILPQYEIQTLIFPLYGAFSLGCYFQAFEEMNYGVLDEGKCRSDIIFVRLGFHDLANINFFNVDGSILLEKLMPRAFIVDTIEKIRNRTALIVDDNVGYGSTFRACKQFVWEMGGHSLARSAETAWHLSVKLGHQHNIADVMDFPSLRTNFHHSLHAQIIQNLLMKNYSVFQQRSMNHAISDNIVQMKKNYRVAEASQLWGTQQLASMKEELDYAIAHWCEPASPEKYAIP